MGKCTHKSLNRRDQCLSREGVWYLVKTIDYQQPAPSGEDVLECLVSDIMGITVPKGLSNQCQQVNGLCAWRSVASKHQEWNVSGFARKQLLPSRQAELVN